MLHACAVNLLLNNSISYYAVATDRVNSVNYDDVAKDLLIPPETAMKMKEMAAYGTLSARDKQKKRRPVFSDAEREQLDLELSKKIVPYILFEILKLDIDEAYARAKSDQTNFLSCVRLNRDFDRIYRATSADVKLKCAYRKVDAVFYTLFPDWFTKNQSFATARDILCATGEVKAGEKLMAVSPEFSDEVYNATEYNEFADHLDKEMYLNSLKEWHFREFDNGFARNYAKFVNNKEIEELCEEDHKIILKMLLGYKENLVHKHECPGSFDVIKQKRKFETPADVYFLNMPKSKMYALAEWYEKERQSYNLPDNKAINFCFSVLRLAREQYGVDMAAEMEDIGK